MQCRADPEGRFWLLQNATGLGARDGRTLLQLDTWVRQWLSITTGS